MALKNDRDALRDLLTGGYNQQFPMTSAEEYDPMVELMEAQPQQPAESSNPEVEAIAQQNLMAAEQEVSAPSESTQKSPPVAKDPLQLLLEQYQKSSKQGDARIQTAQEKEDNIELLNNLNKTFTGLNEGLSNAGGYTNIKLNPLDLGKQNLVGREEKRKDSELSGLLDQYKIKAGAERQKQMDAQRQEELNIRKQYLDEKQKSEARILNQSKINTARGLLKDDPKFKIAQEQMMELDKVNNILDSVEQGNEMSVAALGTTLAKAMGEKGVLTDADVTRYMNSQSWGRKFLDWASKGAKGTLPKATLDELKANVGNIRNALAKTNDKIYGNAANRMKTAYRDYDIQDEEIKGLLGVPEIKPSKTIQKKQYSPSRNQTKIIYSDGTEEILDGKQ